MKQGIILIKKNNTNCIHGFFNNDMVEPGIEPVVSIVPIQRLHHKDYFLQNNIAPEIKGKPFFYPKKNQ